MRYELTPLSKYSVKPTGSQYEYSMNKPEQIGLLIMKA